MNTVMFTFSSEFNEYVDYWCETDEDTLQIHVYVNDVEDELINGLNDAELCEFYGMDSEFLISSNRSDFY